MIVKREVKVEVGEKNVEVGMKEGGSWKKRNGN